MTLMSEYSTRQAAKKLGVGSTTLAHYIEVGKVPSPKVVRLGNFQVHVWTEAEIEHVRKLLPKIANGRKTRWQKQREKQKAQAGVSQPHHAKTARAGGPTPVPHKKKKSSKKK
jgi:predicted DNA-binding transcriptional regulator AlpA